MSLPSYVINWQEIYELLKGKLDNIEVSTPQYKGVSKVWGTKQGVPAIQGKFKIAEWVVPNDISLSEITFSQSSWKSEDFWDLWIDDNKIIDRVYTKELGDKKSFNITVPIHGGQTIKAVLHNNSGNSRDVWIDIDYVDLLGQEISEGKLPIISPHDDLIPE